MALKFKKHLSRVYIRNRDRNGGEVRVAAIDFKNVPDQFLHLEHAINNSQKRNDRIPALKAVRVLYTVGDKNGNHTNILEDEDGALLASEIILHPEKIRGFQHEYRLCKPDILGKIDDVVFVFCIGIDGIKRVGIRGNRDNRRCVYTVSVSSEFRLQDSYSVGKKQNALSAVDIVSLIDEAIDVWERDEDCTHLPAQMYRLSAFMCHLLGVNRGKQS